MKEKSGTFQSTIHDENYLDKFDKDQAGCAGMVFDSGRFKESLNGRWNFSVDPYDNCLRSQWYLEKAKDEHGLDYPLDYDFDRWEKIDVPSCWNLFQKEYFWYEGPAVFTRKFKYMKKGEDRVFIRIGAVNYKARIFLNREYLGFHKGGSTPFYFEVTGLLQEDNRILIVVDNTRRPCQVPMDNTDWFNYGGIYRDVEIIRLPETFIKGFSAHLVPNGRFNRISFSVTLSDKKSSGEAVIRIGELGLEKKVDIRSGEATIEVETNPELWSPDNPKLYDVEVRYKKDFISDRMGFREIRVSGQDILLNGKKIFLKGICFHEESVKNGKAVTEDEIRENFGIMKDLNCNYARLAHYPHSEKVSRIADEVGILLWEEIPVYWAIDFGNRETYDDAQNQLTELIKRDRNRASVIIWSVGNENADTDERLEFMKDLALKAKAADPSRLVSAACLVDRTGLIIKDRLTEYLDIIGLNEYYGWYEPDINDLKKLFDNSKPDKPVIISEFGADARAGARGTADDLWTEDKQLEVYRTQCRTFAEIPYIKGISPWILFDFRCPRRNNPFQQFYNRKGLVSEDKKLKKLAYYCLKEFYGKINRI
jgi:beta-glucuronidase